MHPEKLQAFVLSSLDYGESDRILSLFTLEYGRFRAFARRARNSRRRFGAAMETFARVEVEAGIKEGLSSLRQADVLNVFPRIRSDLSKIAHALYACELVEALAPEGQPLPRLFRLLSAYLERLEAASASEPERRFFEINLLNVLGYRPALDGCARCGSPFAGGGALLRDDGEVCCRLCGVTGRPLETDVLRRLLACLGTGTFGLIAFPGDTLEQAGVLIDQVLAGHAGRRLKSLEFLRQLDAGVIEAKGES